MPAWGRGDHVITVELLANPQDASGRVIDNLGEYYVKDRAEKVAAAESMKYGLECLVVVTSDNGRKRKPFRRGRVHNPRTVKAFDKSELDAAGVVELPFS